MNQKEKRIRCQNFSAREEDTLVSLVEKYKGVIESKKTDAVFSKQKRETWEKIKEEFCAHSDTHRTSKMLREKYENMKKKTKVLMSSQKRELYITGGGLSTNIESSSTTNRLAALMGDSATGLENAFDGDRIELHEIECPSVVDEVQDINEVLIFTDEGVNITTEEQTNKKCSSWNPTDVQSTKTLKLCVPKKRKLGNYKDSNCKVTKAQSTFFENEEMRAAERHIWEKDLNEKRKMWEEELKNKQLELINIKIEREKNKTQR